MIACQGRVTLVKLSGAWNQKLRELPKPYSLSKVSVDKISTIIDSKPLPQGRSHTKPYYEELGPYDVGGKTELTFTNHHFFLTAWIITRDVQPRPDDEVLTRATLMDFYIDGQTPHTAIARNYWLPSEFRVVAGAPIPDVLINRHFRGGL